MYISIRVESWQSIQEMNTWESFWRGYLKWLVARWSNIAASLQVLQNVRAGRVGVKLFIVIGADQTRILEEREEERGIVAVKRFWERNSDVCAIMHALVGRWATKRLWTIRRNKLIAIRVDDFA